MYWTDKEPQSVLKKGALEMVLSRAQEAAFGMAVWFSFHCYCGIRLNLFGSGSIGGKLRPKSFCQKSRLGGQRNSASEFELSDT
jgi:hypothetical protein